MKDAIGRTLSNGDLLVYSPQNSYRTHLAVVTNTDKCQILSGYISYDETLRINLKTGSGVRPERVFLIARRGETDDYEAMYDAFLDKLEELNIKL